MSLLLISGVHCRQHTDHLMSYAKALKNSVETAICRRCLLVEGPEQRTTDERLPYLRVGDILNDGWWAEPGARPTIIKLSLMSTKQRVPSHRGVRRKLLFVIWSRCGIIAEGVRTSRERYRRVVEAADVFVARWSRDDAEQIWLGHATQGAKSLGNGDAAWVVGSCTGTTRYWFVSGTCLTVAPNSTLFICFY